MVGESDVEKGIKSYKPADDEYREARLGTKTGLDEDFGSQVIYSW